MLILENAQYRFEQDGLYFHMREKTQQLGLPPEGFGFRSIPPDESGRHFDVDSVLEWLARQRVSPHARDGQPVDVALTEIYQRMAVYANYIDDVLGIPFD